eukprot:2960157-Rhodomonas_salina.1
MAVRDDEGYCDVGYGGTGEGGTDIGYGGRASYGMRGSSIGYGGGSDIGDGVHGREDDPDSTHARAPR